MSYTVLARRYRSKDFDDLIGQEPIARTLRNAIETNHVAHAYLFCGTRGVGKTSTARILAKALNCEKGPTPKPCNQCDRCKSISAGEDIDVIEIDGASNRGIDDIKDLRASVIYRPARAPYKIYIIDEVHQLSKDAFNALLKTLEEPPSHVKFIFATTEPQKVPQTISSRCQEFVFRLIPTPEIAARLKDILAAEKIAATPEAIERVARAGRGSMRDALSLMDQLLAMGADKLTEDMVDYLLGEPAIEQLVGLVEALASGDAAAALTRTDGMLASGYSPEQFVVSLIEHLRRLMLVALIGEDCGFLDAGAGERQQLAAQAKRYQPMTLVYMIQLLDQSRRSVRETTIAGRALLDAAIARLAMLDQFADTAELVERLEGGPAAPAGAGGEAKKKFPAPLTAEPSPASPAAVGPGTELPPNHSPAAGGPPPLPADAGPPLVTADVPLERVAGKELWSGLIARLSQARQMTLAGPLKFTELQSAEGNTLRVAVQPDVLRVLATPQRQQQLEAAAGQLLSRRIRIEWVPQAEVKGNLPAASASPAPGRPASPPADPTLPRLSQKEIDQVAAEPIVRQILEIFDAEISRVERRAGHPA